MKNEYVYTYKLRGFSLGCQPIGFIGHDDNVGRWGSVTYNRELTEKEMYEYDLVPYGNKEYEIIVNEINDGSFFNISLYESKNKVANKENLSPEMTEKYISFILKEYEIPLHSPIEFQDNGSHLYNETVAGWL